MTRVRDRGRAARPPRSRWLGRLLLVALLVVCGTLGHAVHLRYGADARPATGSGPEPSADGLTATRAPVVLLLGGTGAAGSAVPEGEAWPNLVAAELGWTLVDLSADGTGFRHSLDGEPAQRACGREHCPSFVAAARSAAELERFDLVLVSGGRTEVGEDPARTQVDVELLFATLAETQPGTPVVTTTPIWDDTLAPRELDTLTDQLRAATPALLDLGQPLQLRPDLVDAEGRPDATGHRVLAEAVLAAWPAFGADPADPGRVRPDPFG